MCRLMAIACFVQWLISYRWVSMASTNQFVLQSATAQGSSGTEQLVLPCRATAAITSSCANEQWTTWRSAATADPKACMAPHHTAL